MNINYLRFNLKKKMSKEIVSYSKSTKPRIFIYQLPFYGNIGDQAIALAMIQFLKDNFKNYDIIENRVMYPTFKNQENLNTDDKICVTGGGNFGDLYPYEMWYRNQIIENHQETEVIVFPVSIFYKKEKRIKYDQKYYNRKNVKLMVREEKSFNFAKKNYHCNLLLVADIVNYLKWESVVKRDNKTCLLKRKDKETEINPEQLIDKLNVLKLNYKVADNHVNFRITNSDLMKQVVVTQLDNLSANSLIITDRLHGMIFAYITKTPAIVLPANIKILESYNLWYKDVENIEYVNSIDNLTTELIEKVQLSKNNTVIYDDIMINCIVKFITKN